MIPEEMRTSIALLLDLWVQTAGADNFISYEEYKVLKNWLFDDNKVPWDKAADWVGWFSINANGKAMFWKNEPYLGETVWRNTSGIYKHQCMDFDLLRGINWRETLQKRPEGV